MVDSREDCLCYGRAGLEIAVATVANATMFCHLLPVSRFECVSGLSVYPVEIRLVNNLSSSEDCSTDYCQPV